MAIGKFGESLENIRRAVSYLERWEGNPIAYAHIENAGKHADIILGLGTVYADEKVHGTSCHLAWDGERLTFFAGGIKQAVFEAVFPDHAALADKFRSVFSTSKAVVYGEGYGGSCQRMSASYGLATAFIVFDIASGGADDDGRRCFLEREVAVRAAERLGLEFVPFATGPSTREFLDGQRDVDSVVAVRRGCGPGHHREGIVIRPLTEQRDRRGNRVIFKHKRLDFTETKTPRELDPAAAAERALVRSTCESVVAEYVTEQRLDNVLSHVPGDRPRDLTLTRDLIRAMQADVQQEYAEDSTHSMDGGPEPSWSKEVEKAVGAATAVMWKKRCSELAPVGA